MAASFFIAFRMRPVKESSILMTVQIWLLPIRQMSCPCRSLWQILSDLRWWAFQTTSVRFSELLIKL